jgi:hypothetical protein
MKLLNKIKENGTKILATAVLVSFVAPISFLIFKICTTSNDINLADENERVRSDYVLMLLQCIIGIIAMAMPSIITKRFKLEIPNKMYYMYVIFLYAAIFLGEVRNFYYLVPYWDTIMHSCSAVMIGFLGFSLVDILNDSNKNVTLSPFFIALFAFCFAVSLGAIWEIYEFTSDTVLKTNMQKFKLEDGTELIGKEALTDTMEDIIVDAIGAFAASTIGYISIKYKKGWINGLRIRIKGRRDEYVIDEEDYLKTDDTAHLK